MTTCKNELRTGYTTGTCAAACAKAAMLYLMAADEQTEMDTPLPDGSRLVIPLERVEREAGGVRVTVIKDGGDDPDATHGAEIQAFVTMIRDDNPLSVQIRGGVGVGRVTLPGLPVEVGQAAINPVPLEQIRAAVLEAAAELESGTVKVVVEVPKGEELAKKTMNPRLGIVGGISILGTQGVVKPFSHDSWKASIAEALDVAKAQGLDSVVFTTGRRSERFFQERHPETPDLAMVQAADFFEFSMQEAAQRGFLQVSWAVFFGKLVKHAQGLAYTHAKTHPVDFSLLAEVCEQGGAPRNMLEDIRGANTARQVLQMLESHESLPRIIELLTTKARKAAEDFAGQCVIAHYTVFDFDGRNLNPAYFTSK